MSTAHPTPTPLPVRPGLTEQPDGTGQRPLDGQNPKGGADFQVPKLRLNILDLNHAGASRFLAATNAAEIFAKSVETVLRLLYRTSSNPGIPGTRSVTLFLEDMGGVAYTKGSDLDDDHKEIRECLSVQCPP